MVALKHSSSTNDPISMSQEVNYLQDDESLDDCHRRHRGDNNNDDEDNAKLVQSTVDSDCIDLDHVFTTRTSSQMHCSTIHTTCLCHE
jgi:hypothetical protein